MHMIKLPLTFTASIFNNFGTGAGSDKLLYLLK